MKTLPANTQIEIEARIILDGKVHQGVCCLDGDGEPLQFEAAGLAAQAGAYEVLKAIWPKQVDTRPPGDTMSATSED